MSEVILATGGYDEKVVLWNPTTEVASKVLPLREVHVNALRVSTDRRNLAVAAFKSLKIYDLASGATVPAHSLDAHQGNIMSMGYPRRGNWMYTTGEDGTIRIWDLNTDRAQRCYEHRSPVNTAVLHPNQSEIICGDEQGRISIYDLTTNSMKIQRQYEDEGIRSLQVSGDASFIMASNNNGVCFGIDPVTLDIIFTQQLHNTYITRCVLSPDSKLLATCSADKTVKIWKVNMQDADSTLSLEKALIGHKMWVWDAAFTCDSAYIATASTDNTAKLWECSTGRIARNYMGVHSKGITSIVLNDLA
jgi:G protein beta subunit-like protein